MITISDVAREAGVSASTVSRILNQDDSFSASAETVDKVQSAVNDLGYRPLRRRNTGVKRQIKYRVAIAVTVSKEGETSDPYWTSIRMGIEKKAAEFDMSIEKLVRIDHEISLDEFGDMDGIIVMGAVIPKTLEDIGIEHKNVVLVNNSNYDCNGYDMISSDLYEATINNLKLLQSIGHHRVGFIGGIDYVKNMSNKTTEPTDDARKRAYVDFMTSKGAFIEGDVYLGDWTSAEGNRLMQQAIDRGDMPSAFLVASDPMSMGALHALRESGLRVPEDVSIISYDDIEAAAFLNPPLSSVRLHTEEVGKQAVNVMVDRLKGRELPVKVIVQSHLAVRESFQPAK